MHLEGKLHIGYLKIREKLRVLKDKRHEERRRGVDKYSGRNRHRSRSRSNEKLRRAADEKLKEESQLYFYYSSNRYGVGSNMPKLSMLGDQARVKFADMVVNCNNKDQDQLPFLEGTLELGKEWRYYKKVLEKQKRDKKNAKEREQRLNEASNGGGQGKFGRFDGGGFQGREQRDNREFRRPPQFLGKRDFHGFRK